ncbi:hypothetical protein CQA63_09140, partial [Helicobacter marmotae]
MSKATRQSQSYCHSEPLGEESLQNPHTTQPLCHSEGFMPEESLPESLVAYRDSSVVSTPARHDNESNPQDKITLQGKLVCHSELSQESEESLNESLVAKRDSSPAMQAQNDNKSQTSFSSEIYSHCDKIKSHEVPPLKASSGWGIYKGEGATSQFKPLPLIKKEK